MHTRLRQELLDPGAMLATLHVASLAAAHGATHLKAEMLDHNRPMVRLLERLGRTVQTMQDGHITAYTRLPLRAERSAA